MALQIFQSPFRDLQLMQTQWASQLNPLLKQPLSQASLLKSISLTSGSNTINHGLGRDLQGWVVSGMHGAFVQLYDLPSPMPSKTLILHSNGSASIDLIVF